MKLFPDYSSSGESTILIHLICQMLIVFSLVLITLPSNVYGEEISITSIALEETSLLELTNDSTKDVNTLRIWLGSDFNFKSYKT